MTKRGLCAIAVAGLLLVGHRSGLAQAPPVFSADSIVGNQQMVVAQGNVRLLTEEGIAGQMQVLRYYRSEDNDWWVELEGSVKISYPSVGGTVWISADYLAFSSELHILSGVNLEILTKDRLLTAQWVTQAEADLINARNVHYDRCDPQGCSIPAWTLSAKSAKINIQRGMVYLGGANLGLFEQPTVTVPFLPLPLKDMGYRYSGVEIPVVGGEGGDFYFGLPIYFVINGWSDVTLTPLVFSSWHSAVSAYARFQTKAGMMTMQSILDPQGMINWQKSAVVRWTGDLQFDEHTQFSLDYTLLERGVPSGGLLTAMALSGRHERLSAVNDRYRLSNQLRLSHIRPNARFAVETVEARPTEIWDSRPFSPFTDVSREPSYLPRGTAEHQWQTASDNQRFQLATTLKAGHVIGQNLVGQSATDSFVTGLAAVAAKGKQILASALVADFGARAMVITQPGQGQTGGVYENAPARLIADQQGEVSVSGYVDLSLPLVGSGGWGWLPSMITPTLTLAGSYSEQDQPPIDFNNSADYYRFGKVGLDDKGAALALKFELINPYYLVEAGVMFNLEQQESFFASAQISTGSIGTLQLYHEFSTTGFKRNDILYRLHWWLFELKLHEQQLAKEQGTPWHKREIELSVALPSGWQLRAGAKDIVGPVFSIDQIAGSVSWHTSCVSLGFDVKASLNRMETYDVFYGFNFQAEF